jgi:hypothetical protein
MSEFESLAIGGVLVMPLVLGLVQFAKKFGLDGIWNIVVAVGLGIFFGGIAFGIEEGLIAAAWVPYIKWVVFALSVGLGTGGLYDVGKTRFGTNEAGKTKFGEDIE